MAYSTPAISEREAGEHCEAISQPVCLSSLWPQRIFGVQLRADTCD